MVGTSNESVPEMAIEMILILGMLAITSIAHQ